MIGGWSLLLKARVPRTPAVRPVSETRRKYIRVGSGPASLRGTVSQTGLTTRVLDRGNQPQGPVLRLGVFLYSGFAAGLTQSLNLEHLMLCRKTEIGRGFLNQCIDLRIVQFGDRAATATNQELAAVRAARIGATDECVQRIQAMHQIGLDQEIERSIDCGRCCFFPHLFQAVENVIGTDRFMAIPDQPQNLLTQCGESQAALAAQFFRCFQRLRYTNAVIVPGGWNGVRRGCLVHKFRSGV